MAESMSRQLDTQIESNIRHLKHSHNVAARTTSGSLVLELMAAMYSDEVCAPVW